MLIKFSDFINENISTDFQLDQDTILKIKKLSLNKNNYYNWILDNYNNGLINIDTEYDDILNFITKFNEIKNNSKLEIEKINLVVNKSFKNQPDIKKFYQNIKNKEANFFDRYEIPLNQVGNFKHCNVLKIQGDITIIEVNTVFFKKIILTYFDGGIIDNMQYFFILDKHIPKVLIKFDRTDISEIRGTEKDDYKNVWDVKYDDYILNLVSTLPQINKISAISDWRGLTTVFEERREFFDRFIKLKNIQLDKKSLIKLFDKKLINNFPKYSYSQFNIKEKIKYNIPLSSENAKDLTDIEKYDLGYSNNPEILSKYNTIFDNLMNSNDEKFKILLNKLKFIERVYLCKKHNISDSMVEELLGLDQVKEKYEIHHGYINIKIDEDLYIKMYGLDGNDFYYIENQNEISFSNTEEYRYFDRYLDDKNISLFDSFAKKINYKIEENDKGDYYENYRLFLEYIGAEKAADNFMWDIESSAEELLFERQKEIKEKMIFPYTGYYGIEIDFEKLYNFLLKERYEIKSSIAELFKDDIIDLELGDLSEYLSDFVCLQEADTKEANKELHDNIEELISDIMTDEDHPMHYKVEEFAKFHDYMEKFNLKLGKNKIQKGKYTIVLNISNLELSDEGEGFVPVERIIIDSTGKEVNKTKRKIKPEKLNLLKEIELFD